MRINEELLERKVAAPVYKTEINDPEGSAALTTQHSSVHKRWHKISPTNGGRSVGIVRLRTKGHGVCFLITRNNGRKCSVSGNSPSGNANSQWAGREFLLSGVPYLSNRRLSIDCSSVDPIPLAFVSVSNLCRALPQTICHAKTSRRRRGNPFVNNYSLH
jgi:hypothetical protein